MHILGKVIGGVLGFLLGRIFGLILGVWLGHQLDKRASWRRGYQSIFSNKTIAGCQEEFFKATFSVMGHMAKAKGVVVRQDIDLADDLMTQMGLQGQWQQTAREAFCKGKHDDFLLRDTLLEFKQLVGNNRDLLRIFLEIQLKAAFADGHLHPQERQILQIVAKTLGFPVAELDRLLDILEATTRFHRSGQEQQQSQGTYHKVNELLDAYKLLGIEQTVSDKELKKAYRKLISQHHPDKLISKGFPPEMMIMAKEKTQDIQKAYELIKQARSNETIMQ